MTQAEYQLALFEAQLTGYAAGRGGYSLQQLLDENHITLEKWQSLRRAYMLDMLRDGEEEEMEEYLREKETPKAAPYIEIPSAALKVARCFVAGTGRKKILTGVHLNVAKKRIEATNDAMVISIPWHPDTSALPKIPNSLTYLIPDGDLGEVCRLDLKDDRLDVFGDKADDTPSAQYRLIRPQGDSYPDIDKHLARYVDQPGKTEGKVMLNSSLLGRIARAFGEEQGLEMHLAGKEDLVRIYPRVDDPDLRGAVISLMPMRWEVV